MALSGSGPARAAIQPSKTSAKNGTVTARMACMEGKYQGSLKLGEIPPEPPSMSASHPGFVRRFFRGVWRVVDVSRRVVLNLIFLLILAVVLLALLRSGPQPLAEKTV